MNFKKKLLRTKTYHKHCNTGVNYIHLFHFRSFFQSVCVLGYCILPLNVALIVCRLILLAKHTTALFAVRFVVVILGFAWSTFGKFSDFFKLSSVLNVPVTLNCRSSRALM